MLVGRAIATHGHKADSFYLHIVHVGLIPPSFTGTEDVLGGSGGTA